MTFKIKPPISTHQSTLKLYPEDCIKPLNESFKCKFCGSPMEPYKQMKGLIVMTCTRPLCPNNVGNDVMPDKKAVYQEFDAWHHIQRF